MKIRVYRDCPKPGETDAEWCFIVSSDGHVVKSGIGYAFERDALEAAENFIKSRLPA